MPVIEGGNIIPGSAANVFMLPLGSPAVAATTGALAAVTDNGAPQVITSTDEDSSGLLITQPDVPRNVTATAGGTAGDVKAISVIVAGTNANDVAISETLPAFTVNTTGNVTGSKAFKTITSITIPAHDGVGATTAVGFGSKLGIGKMLSVNSVMAAYLGGTKEGTLPTVAVDNDEIEKNTATLNSSLNGTAVILHVVQ